MRRRNEDVNCNGVERLLIKRSFNELSQEEDLILQAHLEFCDQCRNYQYTLSNLQKAVQSGSEKCPLPNPAIRHNLIQLMETVKVNKQVLIRSFWPRARSVLEYRIPVYQALAGVGLIFFIAIVLSQHSLPINRGAEDLPDFALLETQLLEPMEIMSGLELIEHQKIGRNAKEDSTLTQFLSEAM